VRTQQLSQPLAPYNTRRSCPVRVLLPRAGACADDLHFSVGGGPSPIPPGRVIGDSLMEFLRSESVT
jgi:hypothetical protein